MDGKRCETAWDALLGFHSVEVEYEVAVWDKWQEAKHVEFDVPLM
jgi:hypothetical protein